MMLLSLSLDGDGDEEEEDDDDDDVDDDERWLISQNWTFINRNFPHVNFHKLNFVWHQRCHKRQASQ